MTQVQGPLQRNHRKRGIALVVAACFVIAGAALAFVLVADAPGEALLPQEVGQASGITATPTLTGVRARDGADRLLQRERNGRPCSNAEPVLGCPVSTPVLNVPLFLVRDSEGAIHAFIGEDPQNSCKLLWRSDIQFGVFYDPCHGSLYNRQGQVVGGPSGWTLNEWVVTISDGKVFVDPSKILTGQAPGFNKP